MKRKAEQEAEQLQEKRLQCMQCHEDSAKAKQQLESDNQRLNELERRCEEQRQRVHAARKHLGKMEHNKARAEASLVQKEQLHAMAVEESTFADAMAQTGMSQIASSSVPTVYCAQEGYAAAASKGLADKGLVFLPRSFSSIGIESVLANTGIRQNKEQFNEIFNAVADSAAGRPRVDGHGGQRRQLVLEGSHLDDWQEVCQSLSKLVKAVVGAGGEALKEGALTVLCNFEPMGSHERQAQAPHLDRKASDRPHEVPPVAILALDECSIWVWPGSHKLVGEWVSSVLAAHHPSQEQRDAADRAFAADKARQTGTLLRMKRGDVIILGGNTVHAGAAGREGHDDIRLHLYMERENEVPVGDATFTLAHMLPGYVSDAFASIFVFPA